VEYIIGAVASIDFFGCCSLYRTIYEARGRWHHSWRAIRRASLFAPLKHRLSCSPAKPIVRSVPAHIALHLFVSTHIALYLFVSTHIALHRRVRTLHTLPTQPSVGTYEFFPDVFYASYTSHDQATLDLMENALRRFHEHRDVFQQYRSGKRTTAVARELRTELIKQREAAFTQRRLKGLSPAALRDERHSWDAFINAEVVDCAEDGAHWNCPKLHLMLHFRDQVRRFGSLGQWSTEIGESSHRRQIKDGYNAGNRAGDVYLQIINHYLRLDAFTVRAMNNQAWRAKYNPQRVLPASPGLALPPTVATTTFAASTTTAAATAVTTADAASTATTAATAATTAAATTITADAASAATTAAASTIAADATSTPVSGLPTRLHFVSPQLTTGPSNVTTLGGVFANMWTPEFREAIQNAMRDYLHSQRVLLHDQQLLACPATIHNGLDVLTDDMLPSSGVQRVRCTGHRRWYFGPPRNDWVWVRMVSGSAPLPACASLPYKALQGRLPYRLLHLFTVDLPAATEPHPHWLAFVELTRAVNSGTPEEASQLVRVTKPNARAGYAVIDASGITGAAHLIPQEPNCAGVD
jgi:hypothetical protein